MDHALDSSSHSCNNNNGNVCSVLYNACLDVPLEYYVFGFGWRPLWMLLIASVEVVGKDFARNGLWERRKKEKEVKRRQVNVKS